MSSVLSDYDSRFYKHLCTSFCVNVSFSSRYIPKSGIAGSYGKNAQNFIEEAIELFFSDAVAFHIPTSNVWLHILLGTCYCVFYFSS